MTSITYRYWCATEGQWVEEERLKTDPIPTVCINDATPYQPGTLAIVTNAEQFGDIEFLESATADFQNATIVNFAHGSLDDAGEHTHAEIDAHIDDATIHRQIDDAGSPGPDLLWSSNKISSELSTKSGVNHVHTASNITNFSDAVRDQTNVSQNTTHRSLTNNPHNVTKAQLGLADVENTKTNFTANVAPQANNDINDGYRVGSTWVDQTTKRSYVCVDASPLGAVWDRTDITSHSELSGIGTYTHAQIDAHINNAALHRVIDDSNSESNTVLWSAQQIAGQLATKSDVGHTHTVADITDYATATDSRADDRISLQKGAANGLATLDGAGKIPTNQLPALAITNVSVVTTIAERDALTAETGDVCKVTNSDGSGNPQTFIYDGTEWVDVQETSDVISVNGQTGTVVLTTSNVSEGSNMYWTDGRFDTRFDSRLSTKTTSNVAEGSNLYYTENRFDIRFGTKTTDNLTEGASNLYYTEARVNNNTNVSLNSAHRVNLNNPHQVTKSQVGLGNVLNTKSNFTATSNPTVDNDSTELYTVGSRWVNTTTNDEFVCTDATDGEAVWKPTTARLEQVAVEYVTKSKTPVVARTYLFRGSSIRGIKSIKAIAAINTSSAGFTFDIRVIDYDNSGAVIAQRTGISGMEKKIYDLGTIANVPDSDHIFEVQINRSGTTTGAALATLHTLAFEFD